MIHFSKLSFLFLALSFIACQQKEKAKHPQEMVELPADFLTFYDQFHADSAYQMSHIQWPLRGIPSSADSITWTEDDYYFMPDLWHLHTNEGFNDTIYTRSYKVINPNLIMEFIQLREGPYGMERRFAKMDTSWNMIYYVGMNRLLEKGG